MLIAIDHGNYAVKTPDSSFVSGLSEHTVKPPMADEILEYEGRFGLSAEDDSVICATRRRMTVILY